MARAIERRWRSPPDSERPRSPTGVSERVGRALDEVERLGARGGVAHLGLGGVGLADPQIVGDRAVEQQRLLVDDADVAAERGELDVADVHAVDQDHPGLRVEGAVQQRQRGRLAGPGAADDGDGFPRAAP